MPRSPCPEGALTGRRPGRQDARRSQEASAGSASPPLPGLCGAGAVPGISPQHLPQAAAVKAPPGEGLRGGSRVWHLVSHQTSVVKMLSKHGHKVAVTVSLWRGSLHLLRQRGARVPMSPGGGCRKPWWRRMLRLPLVSTRPRTGGAEVSARGPPGVGGPRLKRRLE